MCGQRIVHFRGERPQLGQARPRDGRKVVVLVVVPDVVRKDVQRAVVAVGLLRETVPEVVLCDEVARAGVEAAGEEAARDQVDEGPPSEDGDEDGSDSDKSE